MTLKLCLLLEYYIRNIFMGKTCRKCAPKASPTFLFNNPKQPLHAGNSFENRWKRKGGYQKALKKSTLFVLTKPVTFNGKSY